MGVAFAVLAGCGSPEEPPPAAPSSVPERTAALPTPPPTPPPSPPVPAPPPTPAPPDAGRPAPREAEKGPAAGTSFDPGIATAGFAIRTADKETATVWINGHPDLQTGSLFVVTRNTAFDPKIPVPAWPPPGAAFCGQARKRDDEGDYLSSVEYYIDGGHYEQARIAELRKQLPHLVEGEHVLYVRADLRGQVRTGALRLRVAGRDGRLFRWVTDPSPPTDEEGGPAARRVFLFQ